MDVPDGGEPPVKGTVGDDLVEIVVRVTEPEFRVLSRLALDRPGDSVGDVGARLIAGALADMSTDL